MFVLETILLPYLQCVTYYMYVDPLLVLLYSVHSVACVYMYTNYKLSSSLNFNFLSKCRSNVFPVC